MEPVAGGGQCGSDPGNGADVSCCRAVLGAATADGGAVSTSEGVGCCKVLLSWGETQAGWQEWFSDYSVVRQCCEALHYPPGPSCTPWGPPVPPPMDRV